MTGDHKDENGMDDLDRQLIALGEAALPDGFDSRLKSFGEMMAAIENVPAGPDDADELAACDAELDEIARDAFELGLGYLDRGDLDRAEHWLGRAARHGLGQAADKLADLAELRAALADIDHDFLPWTRPLSALERALTEELSVEAPSVAQARESARRIIEGARQRAESIIALAEMRARPSANTASLVDECARNIPWWHAYWPAHNLITPLTYRADVGRSIAPSMLVAITSIVVKTHAHSEIPVDVNLSSARHMLVLASSPADGLISQWSRICRERVFAATRSASRPRASKTQDELLQLYEFAGGDVDKLRRTFDWRLLAQAGANGGRDASYEVVFECKTVARTLAQQFDRGGLSRVAFDLMTAEAGGLLHPDAWLEQSDGLVVPSGLRAEPATASTERE
ncbi:hypothetical protein C1I95_25210 [Micromonospora craterilacus]|uniref:Uncharacterized protein n=1 Tax=Micromonospora craterilacus TaxID=1655439 RepID=A0A2W2DLB7_9ACTN|nr:hypothetical protein [Micromonospora craterilacus]PZG12732.1 hypothetical protein C1I95_25210 [Micromonospora craterilacus]